jgi:hypothetical protein
MIIIFFLPPPSELALSTIIENGADSFASCLWAFACPSPRRST